MLNGVARFFRESFWFRTLIPLGLVLIVMSILLFCGVFNNANYIKTDAVVSRTELYEEAYTDEQGEQHEATYRVFVQYTVNGVEYESELGIFSGYNVGRRVKIAYNPNNPTQISQPMGLVLPIILVVAGVASIVGGIVSGVVAIKKNNKLREQEKEWSNGK